VTSNVPHPIPARRQRQRGCRHRTQSGRCQDGRLDHRPRTRRWWGGLHYRRSGDARGDRHHPRELHRQVPTPRA